MIRTIATTPIVLIVYLLMGFNFVSIAACVYWWYNDRSPSRVVYQHPLFLSAPASSRDEAFELQIRQAVSDTTVYRYQEYCLDIATPGIVRRQWLSAVVFSVPDKRNVGRVGCFERSFAEVTPHVIKPVQLDFTMRIDYPDYNPLKTVSTYYQPIPLRVLP